MGRKVKVKEQLQAGKRADTIKRYQGIIECLKRELSLTQQQLVEASIEHHQPIAKHGEQLKENK